MWNARLPRVHKFGLKAAGREIAIGIDRGQDEQITALMKRTDQVEQLQEISDSALDEIVRYILPEDKQYDFFNHNHPLGASLERLKAQRREAEIVRQEAIRRHQAAEERKQEMYERLEQLQVQKSRGFFRMMKDHFTG